MIKSGMKFLFFTPFRYNDDLKSFCHPHSLIRRRFLPEETLNPLLPIECPSGSDQTVQVRMLIWVLGWHTCQHVPFAEHMGESSKFPKS